MSILTASAERVITHRGTSRALRYLPVCALVIDFVVILSFGSLAMAAREQQWLFEQPIELTGQFVAVGMVVLLGWLLMLVAFGSYQTNMFGEGSDEYRRVVNGSLAAAALVGVGCYLVQYELSRSFYMMAFGGGVPALVLGRIALRRVLHRARRRGSLVQRILIAGSRAHIDEVAAALSRQPWLGYQVVGALTPAYDLSEETRTGIPVLGNADEAASVAMVSDVDVIFFAGGSVGSSGQMRKIIWELEHQAVQVVVAPSVTEVAGDRIRVRPVGGLPLMHIDPPTATDASRWGKRLFDIVGATLLLIAFSPLLLVSVIQIKRFDGGPVVFRQVRVGKDGQPFCCLKFRSMVVNAEALLATLQGELGHKSGLFKMEGDPRITRPGRWIRRFSIDELPQLVNVLRGDMSLVGPRPPLPHEVASYENDTHRRLRVRPGMTGLWQVSGRSDLSWSEAVRLDLYYVDNWSMIQDLTILWRTLGAVLSARGAY